MAGRRKRNPLDFSFDFSALDFDDPEEQAQASARKLNTRPPDFDNAEQLADLIDYSKDYFCFVPGSFIFGDFLEALCFKKHLDPSVMYITTLGMGKENADSIVNLVDYLHCKHVNLIVSHYFQGAERNDTIPYMQQEFAGKPIDIAVLRSHCKIALIRSDKGDCVISGSANLSSSNNAEQFVIQHDAGVVDYVQSRMDEVMRRFTVYKGKEN